jgi:hypothetical protein
VLQLDVLRDPRPFSPCSRCSATGSSSSRRGAACQPGATSPSRPPRRRPPVLCATAAPPPSALSVSGRPKVPAGLILMSSRRRGGLSNPQALHHRLSGASGRQASPSCPQEGGADRPSAGYPPCRPLASCAPYRRVVLIRTHGVHMWPGALWVRALSLNHVHAERRAEQRGRRAEGPPDMEPCRPLPLGPPRLLQRLVLRSILTDRAPFGHLAPALFLRPTRAVLHGADACSRCVLSSCAVRPVSREGK